MRLTFGIDVFGAMRRIHCVFLSTGALPQNLYQ
jgi:hypothetical protein